MKNTTTIDTTIAASSDQNPAIIDSRCFNAINKTVSYTLHMNAGSWISDDDIQDIVQSAALHLWQKKDLYNPEKGASFITWTNTVVHNYAIQISRKLKKSADMTVSISGLDGASGMITSACTADFDLNQAAEDIASKKRIEALNAFIDTNLNESEKLLFCMLKDGLSKKEMMEITHKTGGNIDTSIHRLRSKVRRWMKTSDYYGIV